MTFSIVARDPETNAVGVAVQSKFVVDGRLCNSAGEARLVNALWHGLSRLDRK